MDANVKHLIQAVTDVFIVKVDVCQDKLFQPQKLETSHWFVSSSIKLTLKGGTGSSCQCHKKWNVVANMITKCLS